MGQPLKPIARLLRNRQTKAEDELWRELRGRRLDGWKFRRQVIIHRFIADFMCQDARLIIELDGVHHQDQTARDQERRRIIESEGFLELRFDNDDVRCRIDWVLEEIRRVLDIARVHKPRAPFARYD